MKNMLLNNMTANVCNSLFQSAAIHSFCFTFQNTECSKFIQSASAAFTQQTNSVSKSDADKIHDKYAALRNELCGARAFRNADGKMRNADRRVPINWYNILLDNFFAKKMA